MESRDYSKGVYLIAALNADNLTMPKKEQRLKPAAMVDHLKYLDLFCRSHGVPRETNINLAGKNFKNYASLNAEDIEINLEDEILSGRKMNIMCYPKQEAQKLFNFKENGFIFSSFDQDADFHHAMTAAKDSPFYLDETHLLEAANKLLEKWAVAQNIQYDVVASLGAIYRSESPSDEGNAPLPMTHVDTTKNATNFLNTFSDHWKPNVEMALGKELTDQEFENLQIVQMVNIWMPLNESPTENTLAVMDISRINEKDLLPYSVELGESSFTPMILHFSPKLQFVIQADMKFGDMVIFDSTKTPHTAATIPRPEAKKGLFRESLEIRAIFIQNFVGFL